MTTRLFALAMVLLAGLTPPAATVTTDAGAAPTPVPADTTAQNWTLQQCLDAALREAPTLARRRAEAEAARRRTEAAVAALLPTIGLQGTLGYATETQELAIPTPTGTRSIEFGDGSTADLLLGARATLWAGGALRAERDAATARWRASQAQVAADSLDLRRQVHRAYFAALGAQAMADAAARGVERLRRHLGEVEANREAGVATEEARLQVLARLRRTEQQAVAAAAEAADRRLALGRLVGRPEAQVRPAMALARSLLTGREAARPWDQRPRLRGLDAQIAAAGDARRAAAGAFLPTVGVVGGWHLGRPGLDPIANEWMDYGTVALDLNWTLFDFGGRRARVRDLRAQQRALEALREDVDRGLRERLARARTRLEAAGREADHAAERRDVERRRLGLVEARWRQGHSTQAEVLDAQDDVTLAEHDHAVTQASLRLAEAELLAALGW